MHSWRSLQHEEPKMIFDKNKSSKNREVGAEVKSGKGKQANQGDTDCKKVRWELFIQEEGHEQLPGSGL